MKYSPDYPGCRIFEIQSIILKIDWFCNKPFPEEPLPGRINFGSIGCMPVSSWHKFKSVRMSQQLIYFFCPVDITPALHVV